MRALNTKGFTLVEVMIALAILAGLSLLTAQAIRSGINNKMMLQDSLARESAVTDALRVIRNDIVSAFHHRPVHITMINEVIAEVRQPAAPAGDPSENQQSRADQQQRSNRQNPQAGRNQQQQQQQLTPEQVAALGTPRPTPVPTTGFFGTAESLYFTTLSHVRTIRNSKESDQAQVGYYVEDCKSRQPAKGAARESVRTRCLYRAFDPQLDDRVEEPGPGTVLVENVTEFKLRYLGPGYEDYVETWKTGEGGDANTRENFPYAVEVTLTVHNRSDPKDKPFSQTILAPIRFPNNPPPRSGQEQPSVGLGG